MKLGLVLVFTLIWQLASSEVYFDQSGYGYGVNPKPSASSESKIVNPVVVNGGSSESVSPQESKPEAYLVRLKPKEDQAASSIQNKKSKFLLLLRLPEDQEDTQATSLNSEIQQRDESGYQQTDNQSQDEYLSPLSQTSYTPSSFENQKDESDQYQLQAGPQQQQSEADLAQQKDSGYLQPLQTDGYSQPQNNEQSQQKDESYGQQYQSQQPQQQDVPEDFEQAKDDSGYQQQTYSQQQDSGFEQVPAPSPQFQASALKNGFNPLPSYERQPAQVPTAGSVKGFSNNFFRSPVLQDSVKTTGSYGSNDFQSRDTETQSYGGQQSGVKTPAVQSQAPSSYGFNADSGRKTNSSSSYSEADRDATKSSFQPSFYPSSDSGRKSSTPTGETSSYPSQRSPMKSPAQVYAQQQQQQIEQERKPVSSPVRDFYSQSEQYESDSFGSQQGFGPSTYGSNEESVKSAALPAKDTSNYEAQQDGVKTSPLSSPKQALEKTRPNLVANGYSNTYSSTASLARSPVSSYASQQQVQEQPQQQTQLVQEQPQQQAQQQDDYNQSAQDTEDSQEKDEQSQFSADQQQNSEPEKKVPVILISLPRESNPFASSDNQNKDDGAYSQQQQQSFDSQPKSDSDYQHSSGSLGNDESNYNAPVKGQAPLSSFEQSSQSLQTGSFGQQSAPALGQKSAQQYPTKSSVKTQQSSIDSSSISGVPAAPVKGGRSPQPTSNYDNEYSGGFQVASKDTKSNTKSSFSASKNFQSPAVKGGSSQQQSFDDSYSNEQQEPVKGSSQPNQNNNVQSSYSATLQAPVKAARAFQQSAGYYSEFQASKGVSDSYSRKPQQSPVESKYNDFQASPVQQSQPEPQQQTKSDAGYNLQSSVKGGRPQALPQQTSVNNYNSYQSNSQSSFSDYQSSSGAAPSQQQQIPFGYSSAFKASPVQQISNYESTSQQKVSGGVKGTQNSPVQQQPQRDSYSFPNPSAQPAFASFAASVKGSALSSPQAQQTSQNSDEGYSSGYQVPEASLAPVQQTQPSRGYNAGFQASGVKGGQQQSSGYNSQSSSSYEQSPLSNTQGTKSAPIREQKIAPAIPNYQTKSGRSQLSSTKSTKTVSSYDQKSPSSGYAAAPTFPQQQQQQQQQQQGTKSPVKSQPNTKTLLKNPTTSYLPALSPPGGLKSPASNSKSPSSEKSTSQDSSSYFNFPMNSQQLSQAPKSSPLTRSLPPPPALVARSRPSAQNFNFPSSSTQPSSESYPSYSASSNSPIFDDEEDSMSAITPDNMGAYGLRTNSPYGGTTASASSHIRAVEQPQGSGRVVLLLFNKGHINPQGPQMAFNSGPSGIY